ncbi:N-acetylglucosamine-6-phosphate deacetylase [Aeromicrobium panaciterrae]|uniref:N-acetylglucosamine-6-phosphate deacetylase n=1 Tax=Aeromicrobium panaciterrae TaxID=363861 RepID=UPI0031CFAE84
MQLLVSATTAHGITDTSGPGWIEVVDGMISASGASAPPRTADVHVEVLAPGFIDAQINGAYGADFASATDDDWTRIAARLPSTGVTAMVPTYITAPIEEVSQGVTAYARRRAGATSGTRLLPCHVEGPFLAPTRRGAHREELLVDPTPERVNALIDAGGDSLGYVTLAPERDGALEAIATFVAAGVRVSVGHSDADAATVSAAADAGATLVTHLFNAQSPLMPRRPGVVGAALADPRLTLGLIADLHHVQAEAIRLTFAAAAGRVMLVTDNVSAFGMPPGEYELGGQTLSVTEGEPPLRADGTLAGAAVRLDDCVANSVASGASIDQAIAGVTCVPARALGLDDLGHLRPGVAADFVVLDGALRTQQTWIGGELVFDRESPTVGD